LLITPWDAVFAGNFPQHENARPAIEFDIGHSTPCFALMLPPSLIPDHIAQKVFAMRK
jgi:hypothetical protein